MVTMISLRVHLGRKHLNKTHLHNIFRICPNDKKCTELKSKQERAKEKKYFHQCI